MRSIAARFSLVVGAFALIFSAITLYAAWSLAERHAVELTASQARLALEFDLAIREYAGEVIRPAMAKRIGKDEFVVEAMSTSYIARQVMEKVRREFPSYIIKFSSDNPRNPINRAGPEEVETLEYFRNNPNVNQWTGKLQIGGEEYFAHLSAMRTDESCLRCHGVPADSPQALLDKYGPSGGFYRKVGDVAGIDMIAVPMRTVNTSLSSQARTTVFGTAVWLVGLFAAIFVAFQVIVSRRLSSITRHFRTASRQGQGKIDPVPETGNDEISLLVRGFNSLAGRLRAMHESLEEQVRDRTKKLSDANRRLRREQRLLKRSLRTHDHERQVIAYEIHDGVAQQLVAAIMTFEAGEAASDDQREAAKERRKEGLRTLKKCLAETRRLIDGVRPPLLDEQGVITAVRNLLAECEGDGGGQIEFSHPEEFSRLEPALENSIYRIVQEGVTNAQRHSQSDKIRVSLARDEHHVRVEVQDWGVGFNVKQTRSGGVGLMGIRERAVLLGGNAIFESEPGRGTKITVELPLEPRDGNGEEDLGT